jgi:hypothetical protein
MKLGNAAAEIYREKTNPIQATVVESVTLHVAGEPGLHGPTTLPWAYKNLRDATSFALRGENGVELYLGAGQASAMGSRDIAGYDTMTPDQQSRAIFKFVADMIGAVVVYKRPSNYIQSIRMSRVPANTVMPLA